MKILCGQCGRSLEPTEQDIARNACDCPSCGHRIVLDPQAPAPQAEPEAGFAEQARKAIARRIVVICGKCGKKLHVGLRQAGKAGRCPACREPILIPEHNEGQDFPELSDEVKAERYLQPEQQEELLEVEFDDELAALASAASALPNPAARRRRRSALTMVLVVGIMLLLVSVPTLVVLREYADRKPTAKKPLSAPAEVARVVEPPVEPVPKPQPAPPPKKAPVVPPPPAPVLPAVTVAGAAADVFGPGRYAPAPPGQVYWRVKTVLRPAKAGELATAGDVSLKTPDGPVTSKGVAVQSSLPGPVGQATRMTLRPGAEQTVTFVFLVSDSLREAKLVVAGVGEAPVGPVSLPPVAGELAGDYVEQLPRNLKPLLKNAVMAAVQSVPSQRLELRANGGGAFSVSLPSAGVKGTARPVGGDLLEARLELGKDVLSCHLRVLEGGKTLVLYLSPRPFHQVTFSRG
jgi:DNA-directed RNA polymerase subunit RPC12/RpoP